MSEEKASTKDVPVLKIILVDNNSIWFDLGTGF